MNGEIMMNWAIVCFVIAVILECISIGRNFHVNKMYIRAKVGIKNYEIPSKYGFSGKDLETNSKFSEKFRGSVRLGGSNIYVDEEIENMRIKSKQMLP